jgi:hypothetical protein
MIPTIMTITVGIRGILHIPALAGLLHGDGVIPITDGDLHGIGTDLIMAGVIPIPAGIHLITATGVMVVPITADIGADIMVVTMVM